MSSNHHEYAIQRVQNCAFTNNHSCAEIKYMNEATYLSRDNCNKHKDIFSELYNGIVNYYCYFQYFTVSIFFFVVFLC